MPRRIFQRARIQHHLAARSGYLEHEPDGVTRCFGQRDTGTGGRGILESMAAQYLGHSSVSPGVVHPSYAEDW
jgi:hypothetical protein